MTQITLFDWIVATLTSAASVALLVVALSAASFLGFTLLSALGSPRARRLSLGISVAASAAALITSLIGLRAGGALSTIAVAASLAAAVGPFVGFFVVALSGGYSALSAARARRGTSLKEAEAARVLALEAGRQRFLAGDDLRAEVASADASVERLRAALSKLEALQRDLIEKRSAAPDPALRDDYARLRDELTLKIDLGRRIFEAASAAAFRLACFEPLRRLVRRRPEEATLGLGSARTAAELEVNIDRCADEIKAFLGEIAGARASLTALEARRSLVSSSSPADAPLGEGEAHADPLDRARASVDSLETAYQAVLERAHVVRLRLLTRAGMEEVAAAAGSVSERARTMGVDEGELQKLVSEIARAQEAMKISAPDGADVRALTEALARSVDALDRNDAASLDELLRAMREMD